VPDVVEAAGASHPQISVRSRRRASQIWLTTLKIDRFRVELDLAGPGVGPWSNSIRDAQPAFNGPG